MITNENYIKVTVTNPVAANSNTVFVAEDLVALRANFHKESYLTGTPFSQNARILSIAPVEPGSVKADASTGGAILTYAATPSTEALTADPAAASVEATGGKGNGATFKVTSTSTTTYKAATVTPSSSPIGSGYAADDTLTLPGGIVVTVATVDSTSGGIKTVTLTTTTSQTADVAGSAVAPLSTSGSGTGATFKVTSTSTTTYKVVAITIVNPGSGYAAEDKLTVGEAGSATVSTVSKDLVALSAIVVSNPSSSVIPAGTILNAYNILAFTGTQNVRDDLLETKNGKTILRKTLDIPGVAEPNNVFKTVRG